MRLGSGPRMKAEGVEGAREAFGEIGTQVQVVRGHKTTMQQPSECCPRQRKSRCGHASPSVLPWFKLPATESTKENGRKRSGKSDDTNSQDCYCPRTGPGKEKFQSHPKPVSTAQALSVEAQSPLLALALLVMSGPPF